MMKEGSDRLVRGFENHVSDSIDMQTKVVKRESDMLIPIIEVATNLGIVSEYNQNEGYTLLRQGATDAKIYNSANRIIINGTPYSMGANSEVIANTVMAPVDVLEYFGYRNGKELVVNDLLNTITIRN